MYIADGNIKDYLEYSKMDIKDLFKLYKIKFAYENQQIKIE